jgi:hypothetical protein
MIQAPGVFVLGKHIWTSIMIARKDRDNPQSGVP